VKRKRQPSALNVRELQKMQILLAEDLDFIEKGVLGTLKKETFDS